MAHDAISGRAPIAGTAPRPRFGHGRIFLRSVLFLISAILILAGAGFLIFASQVKTSAASGQPAIADGIVVLTGGKARVETAIGLLQQGMARRLLISGVHPDTSSASIRRAVKGDARMFDCCVDIDKAALDTIGNAEQAAGWARQHGFDSLIIVTSDYHMPRSMLELRRKLPGTTILPYSVPSIPMSITDSATLRLLLPEYAKYVAAQLGLGAREHADSNALAATLRN